jgi:hypothetical protein
MNGRTILRDLVLPVAMMAGFGTFFWGIRGTGGYGGTMGGLFAGTGWAILWYFLSNNDKGTDTDGIGVRPIATRWAILSITIGIMVGGFHGYGQFISWIQGSWKIIGGTPGTTVDVDPAWGFLGLLQCGLCWGGLAGAVLGWAIPGSGDWLRARRAWILRTIFAVAGGLAGYIFFLSFPSLLMPLYGSVYYDMSTCLQCNRAVETAASSAVQFGIFAGIFIAEIVLKNWRGVTISVIMAAGFGVAFVIGSGWFFTPLPSSWKAWEMSIGAMGGASIGFAHFFVNRSVKKQDSRTFAITERMFQPATKQSVVFGHNLPLVLGMSLALYNGMKPEDGFAKLFFSGDVSAISVVMGITYAAIAAMWVFFVVSINFTYKVRYHNRRWFGKPLLQVFMVQGILIAIGFMTTLVPDVPLPESVAFVATTYVWGLCIGGAALFGVVLMDHFTGKGTR